MQADVIDVVVAGHVCLDIIPSLSAAQTRPEDLFVPGGLVTVGPATLALGGCVANSGLALHRLGASTRLVGKVGNDLLGTAILESLRRQDPSLPKSMIVADGEATSYTIVFSPPNVDRGFLHCPGANDSFVADDLDAALRERFRILHFGYPPLMQSIAADQGAGLANKFAAAQSAGSLVSLDMAVPSSTVGTVCKSWRRWLATVLPYVDVFLPSYDEISLMLSQDSATPPENAEHPSAAAIRPTGSQLAEIADELLGMGASIVVIKLGDQGLYLRSCDSLAQLTERRYWRQFDSEPWQGRELLAPCFDVDVVGTTGAGDCTIAGFLHAMLRGAGPELAISLATMVGAHCVQSADATSNIPPWSEIERAQQSSRAQRESIIDVQDWSCSDESRVYLSPRDRLA
jgi:sugar/nucleoside kinase (ribokinase family)